MITGDKNKLDEIARNYVCAEHKTPVAPAWYEKAYTLRCSFGNGHFPEEVTRNPSLTEAYKQGEPLPGPVEDNVKKSIQKRAAALPRAPGAETFTGIPAADLETGELLTLDMVKAVVAYARKYGLDPARGHVVVMHGQPYIGIDGYIYHAKQENIPYSLTGRPLKADELRAQGYETDDLGWHSKVERLDTKAVFEGYGFVKRSELTEKSKKHPDRLRYPVVAEKPGVMVIKRADWQALRRAFPIGESEEVKDNDKSTNG